MDGCGQQLVDGVSVDCFGSVRTNEESSDLCLVENEGREAEKLRVRFVS